MVRVHHDEGVAIHIGPESCAGGREAVREALTGECAGQPLSHEKADIPVPTPSLQAEGHTKGRAIASSPTTRRGQRPWHVQTLFVREPGGFVVDQWRRAAIGPHREGEEPKPMMHGREKSDPPIVAKKPANNAGHPVAEQVERRAGTEGNAGQQSTHRAQDWESVSQALGRVRQAAKQRRKERFTALFHHLTPAMLRTAFFALKRHAAAGVDGVTWQDYEADLDRRIEGLWDRVQQGAYRAQPSRRRYIPKPDGRQRPQAVAALEDKIVQRATTALLNAIYKEELLGFSYGFRPGRSQHDALDALHVGSTAER